MVDAKVGDLHARLDALADRIDASLARVRGEWIERPATTGEAASSPEQRAKLEAAEASARLQALRCAALEDRVAELEAALVGAREQRAQAVAAAESARQQADRALDELEAARRDRGAPGMEAKLTETLQAKLLEVERISSELSSLRKSNDDWRGRARSSRRELDRVSLELERASSSLAELRERDESNKRRLAELEKTVADQRKELEIAERRTKHLREHMGVRSG